MAKWREGYDDVHGTRTERDGEGWFKRATAHGFYRVMQRLSKTPIPTDTGDFRLLSPRSLAALRELRERHRFMKGLFGWVGFRQVAIPYHREARVAGRSKFNFWRLWNFALEGMTSFSTAPLRVATYLGVLTAVVAFVYAAWIVIKAMLWGDPVAGWPTMMTVILFLGGVQLMALGVIGEYLGRCTRNPSSGRCIWWIAGGPRAAYPSGTSPLKETCAMRTVRQLLEAKPVLRSTRSVLRRRSSTPSA